MSGMWLLLACHVGKWNNSTDSTSDTGMVDIRIDPAVAEGADFVIQSPDYVIPPFTDVMWCYWGTWTEPTAGISYYEWEQSPNFGHHAMLNRSDDSIEDYPDGTIMDCTIPEGAAMAPVYPLVQGTEAVAPSHGRMILPEGKAVRIEQGQRWMLQSHYLNSSDRPMLVRDVSWGNLMPEEEVEAWVGGYTFNTTDFSLAPHQVSTAEFTCPWQKTINLLTMGSHMHEWGQSIHGEILRSDGSKELIYEQQEWQAEWRDAPQILYFEDGIPVTEGEELHGTCVWNNDSDDVLEFPTEMCVLMGLAWPLDETLGCDAGTPSE